MLSLFRTWEQRKLGEVVDSYSGGTPLAGNPNYYGGEIPFIRSAEINDSRTELYLTLKGLNSSSAKLVNRGDILYALYGATSGEVGISQINGAINQAILAMVPHENYNSYFIVNWLAKSKTKILETYLQGGQGNLSGEIVKGLEILFPSSREQQLIGSFFAKLDSLITLHQRKLGGVICSIHAWEQRKLGEMCSEILAGGDVDTEKIRSEGPYPVIANALTNEGILGYYEDSFRVKAPAVTVTGRGDVGHAKAQKINFTPVVRLLAVVSSCDSDFLANAINRAEIHLESTGVPQLTSPQLASVEIKFPRQAKEQQAIGAFFQKLDSLITLHQRDIYLLIYDQIGHYYCTFFIRESSTKKGEG